jgi:hypothetical protein
MKVQMTYCAEATTTNVNRVAEMEGPSRAMLRTYSNT